MDEDIGWIIFVVILALGAGIMIGCLIGSIPRDIELSQETGDKICLDLTNESGVVAKDYFDFQNDGVTGNTPIEKGELYCQVPSYDATHLIKVGN